MRCIQSSSELVTVSTYLGAVLPVGLLQSSRTENRVPSGYVKIASENGHRNSWFTPLIVDLDLPIENGDFPVRYVTMLVYQRVYRKLNVQMLAYLEMSQLS